MTKLLLSGLILGVGGLLLYWWIGLYLLVNTVEQPLPKEEKVVPDIIKQKGE
ncbi:hypothetical protein NIES4102_43180 (plasmid) [Chondrocystis sp. NIES-4102]|nr:hypothetical protein NIES4102_43180 [Chondrocystis sp. NIES-4102]